MTSISSSLQSLQEPEAAGDSDALLSELEDDSHQEESLPRGTEDANNKQDKVSLIQFKARVLNCWFVSELKKQFKLFVPITLSVVFQSTLLWVSIVFLGHLPDQPESKKSSQYAAAGLGTSFLNVTGVAIGHGLATASDTLSSQAFGCKNYKRVGVILQRGILILSLLLFPIWALWLNTESLLLLFQQPPCVARFSALYVRMYSLAVPFTLLYILLQHYLQSQSIVWQFVLIGFITNVVNAVLHAITIYGLNLGFTGAVIALVISNALPPVLVLAYVWCRKLHKETWGGWSFESLEEWGLFMKLAVPGLLMLLLEWWGFEILNFIAGALGEVQLAVNIVWFQIAIILFMPALGLSISVSIRVGNELGAGNPLGAKRAAYVAVATVLTFSTASSILLLSTRNFIAKIFVSDDDEVVHEVSRLMYIVWIFDFCDFLQMVISGVLRGSGRQYIGAIVNFIAYYIIGIPLAVVFGFKTSLGILGIWIGMAIGNFSQCMVFILVLIFTNWQKESEKAIKRAKKEELSEEIHSPKGSGGATIEEASDTSSLSSTSGCMEEGDKTNLITDEIELHSISEGPRESKDAHIVRKTPPTKKLSYKMRKLLLHGSFYVIGICILVAGGVSSRFHPHVDPEEYSNCSSIHNSSSVGSGDMIL